MDGERASIFEDESELVACNREIGIKADAV